MKIAKGCLFSRELPKINMGENDRKKENMGEKGDENIRKKNTQKYKSRT